MIKCPGQEFGRKPQDMVYDVPCPECGKEVEFFYDDLSRICGGCDTKIEKDDERFVKDQGCAAWCQEAESCMGPNVYAKFQEALKNVQEKRLNQLEELLQSIPNEEAEVADFFQRAFRENTDPTLLINVKRSVKPLKHQNPELYDKVTRYFSAHNLQR